jgi:DNA invertase Pin-like site-specific DNA recombinase
MESAGRIGRRAFADKGTPKDALGVRIRYVVGDLGDGPEGELVRDVNLAVSKWYGANPRQEVIRGMQEKVGQGGWPHQAPLGYLNDRKGAS